jgi:tetratricopeptide (TPR) repeat protein
MRRTTGFVLTLALVTLLMTQAAWGEVPNVSAEARAEAQEHNRQAQIQYNLGRFAEALEEYSAAYELFPHPAFLFNLGQCNREIDNHDRAIFFFEGYLRQLPNAANRELVESLLNESHVTLQEQREREAAEAREEASQALDAGLDDSSNGDAGQEVQPPLVDDDDDEQDMSSNERPFYRRWWFWTIIGSVVVGGTAAGLAVGLTRDDENVVLPEGSLGTVDWR